MGGTSNFLKINKIIAKLFFRPEKLFLGSFKAFGERFQVLSRHNCIFSKMVPYFFTIDYPSGMVSTIYFYYTLFYTKFSIFDPIF